MTRISFGLAVLLTACTGQASEHIVIGLVPGSYTVNDTLSVTTSELGIARYTLECLSAPCTVTITQGVHASGGCSVRPRTEEE